MNGVASALVAPGWSATARQRRLLGRGVECEVLDGVVHDIRMGRGRALLLRGKEGVGKTALLEYLAMQAGDCHLVRMAGAESERALEYAALHRFCAPFLDRLDRVPGPQRDALAGVLGLRGGVVPDRLLVGLAVLSLVTAAGEDRPLVCIVDDAQWLDQESAHCISFVARRLGDAGVAVVCATRDGDVEPALTGLGEMAVGGLLGVEARVLLESVVPGPLDGGVRDRLLAESRGNSRLIRRLLSGPSPQVWAGGFGLPPAAHSADSLQETFWQQVEALPSATRLLLLVVAAEPTLDSVVVWRAAGRLGVAVGDATPAAAAGLVDLGGPLCFCHPLARSAAYWAAAEDQRRCVHRALADATNPATDPERHAWHRACGTGEADESVAAELEAVAGRARLRFGLGAAAAFYDRAATLTPDPLRRAERALEAAYVAYQAGASNAVLRLLATPGTGSLDDIALARVEHLHAKVAVETAPSGSGARMLLAAAKRLDRLHPGVAREAYRDAFWAARTAGGVADRHGMAEIAGAVLAREPEDSANQSPHAYDLVLEGLATVATRGYALGAPILRSAVRALAEREIPGEEAFRWLPMACCISRDLWDDRSWSALASQLIERARRTGAVSVVPIALSVGSTIAVLMGESVVAESMVEEGEAFAEATGNRRDPYGPLVLAAWRGREVELGDARAAGTKERMGDEAQWHAVADWATAVLKNGLCRYDEAFVAAERVGGYFGDLGMGAWSLVELTEAAARSGRTERARDALGRLSQITGVSGTDWALGIEARCRALLHEGEVAEREYQEAIERLGHTLMRAELARAHLLYGEWLRREKRRVDAREQLRTAHAMFSSMGLDGFAGRASRELLATGATVRKRTVDTVTYLTAQEMQIACLASAGFTNHEIGTQLFLSSRTVEWHLRKVFTKLNITSRKELPKDEMRA